MNVGLLVSHGPYARLPLGGGYPIAPGKRCRAFTSACARPAGALVDRARACVLLNKDVFYFESRRWRAGAVPECLETRHEREDGERQRLGG